MTDDTVLKQGQRASLRSKKCTSKLFRKGTSTHLQELSLTNTKKCNLTLKSVNHSEKCKREGGFSTACSAADPNLWQRKKMNIKQVEMDSVCIRHLGWRYYSNLHDHPALLTVQSNCTGRNSIPNYSLCL